MRNNSRGFTLLELVATIGILSIVLGYFTIYFSNEIKLYYSKDNDLELKQNARIALDRIASKIRRHNGLTFSPGASGTGMIYKGSQVIINTVENDSEGEINFYFDSSRGVGEIRDSSGNRIIGNVKSFRLEKEDIPGTDGLVRIVIMVGNNKTSTTKQYATAVRLYYLSGL